MGLVRRAMCGALCAMCSMMGCDRGATTQQASTLPEARIAPEALGDAPQHDVATWALPEAKKRAALPPATPAPLRPCHARFEPHDIPIEQWERADQAGTRALDLGACRVEAWRALEDGALALAYNLPNRSGGAAQDLRLLVYEADGTLRYSARQGRQASGGGFVTSYQGSFITAHAPHLLCFGTRWDVNVQVSCLDLASGERRWEGTFDQWSGVTPQAIGAGLAVASTTTMRRHYAYSGVEMRSARLDASGSRGSLYASDATSLFFAPGDEGAQWLAAYDLETMKRRWMRALPGAIEAHTQLIAPEQDLLVVKHQDALLGLNTGDGALRWRVKVGILTPPMVAAHGRVYVLQRHAEAVNQLLALNATTGALEAWVEVAGALDLSAPLGVPVIATATTALTLGEPL